jgi:hypothetical protein
MKILAHQYWDSAFFNRQGKNHDLSKDTAEDLVNEFTVPSLNFLDLKTSQYGIPITVTFLC